MKKSTVFLSSVICLILFASYANALDSPHDTSNALSCSSCHFTYGNAPTWWQQAPDAGNPDSQYPFNRLCWTCHDGSKATIISKTHSDFGVNGNLANIWARECRACHYPHTQRQTRRWGASSYVYSGASTSVTSNTIVQTGAGWTTNQWQGYVVFGNTSYLNFNYRVVSNTADTLTMQGTINTAYITAGNTFGITYGKLVKDYVNSKNVKFFRTTPPNNLADGDGTIDGICEVCHTATLYYKNDGTGASHNPGVDCTSCHSHNEGFKGGGCSGCHGYPPTVDNQTQPNGLVWSTTTGSATAGVHGTHNTKGVVCGSCHINSVGTGATHNANKTVTLGFSMDSGAVLGGSYNGQAGVSYNSSEANTAVSAGGLKQCSGVYCHGSTMATNGGTDRTPIWSSAATGSCGTCHAATAANPPTLGSHQVHAGQWVTYRQLDCTVCHYNYTTVHVNNRSEVSFDKGTNTWLTGASYNGTTAMLDAYGNCSNLYCHSNVQSSNGTAGPTSFASPKWGSAATGACGTCHLNATIASGSHGKHVGTYSMTSCTTYCHVGAGDNSNKHSDHNIDVSIAGTFGGSYSQPTGTPGDGYGTCSSAYCHSDGTSVATLAAPVSTASWGTVLDCGGCHGVGNTPAGWPTYTSGTKKNSHVKHSTDCTVCHSATVSSTSTISNAANHTNKVYNVVQKATINTFSYAFSTVGGTCTSISCHGAGTATWGGTLLCDGCHNASSIMQGKHAAHYNWGSVATNTNAWNSSTSSAYIYGCGTCHDPAVATHAGGYAFTTIQAAEVAFNGTVALGGSYTRGAATAGTERGLNWTAGAATNACASTYCHSQGQTTTAPFGGGPNTNTITWVTSSTLNCTGCHNFDYASTKWMTSGRHLQHVGTVGDAYSLGCQRCHNATTTNGTSITDKTKHVNKTRDVAFEAFNPSGTWNAATSACATSYCHSNGMAAPTYATPTWTSAATGACGTCHGANNITTPGSTVHAQHVGTIAQYEFACSRCHNATVSATADSTGWATIISKGTTGLHVNGTRDVAFDAYNTGGTFVGGKCNALYCHSDGTSIGNPSAALISTVGWSGTLDCGGCHGKGNTPAGWPTYTSGTKKNSHAAHPTDCTLCHSATVSSASTISNAANHTNKVYNVVQKATINTFSYAFSTVGGTCTSISCHGAGTATWGGTLLCDGCHNASSIMQGKHAAHYNWGSVATNTNAWNSSTSSAYIYGCGTCHDPAVATHAGGYAFTTIQAAEVAFNGTVALGGSYTRGAATAGTERGLNWTAGAATNACASTYCHSQGQTTTAPFGGGPNTNTITWVTSSTLNCTGCHNFDYASTKWMTSGRHLQHVGTVGDAYSLGCQRCHNATTTNGTSITDKTKHVNKTRDVAFEAFNPSGTWNAATSACATSYCHSNGMAAPTYATPTWTSAATGACGTCHGANNITTPGSTVHAQHVGTIAQYEFACSRCHNATVSATADSTGWATIISKGTTGLHVNGTRDVAFDAYNTGGTFVGGKCNALYCHSDGTSIGNPSAALISTVGWSGTLDCGGCHGKGNTPAGWPTYTSGTKKNSHAAHPTDCTLCHSATVSSTSTISNAANHTNKLYNVVQKATINTFSYAFSTVGGTCTAVSCHGGGSGTWGGGSLACDTCHAASNILAGKHSQHYEWGSVATTPAKSAWNSTTNTAYIFSCGVCHDSTATTHAGGDWTTFAAAEVDFDATIALGGSYRPHTTVAGTDQGNRKWTPGWQSNACASTYCHSQGRTVTAPFGGAPNTNTFQWVTSSTLTCAGCHSTTAWNTSPHMTHANTWATSYSYDCTRCHNATALSGINTIANKTKHVNKVKDIAFDTWNPQGTIINNTCQQTYCHSSGTGWTSNLGDNTRPLAWRTVSWTDTVNCGTCHGSDATGRPTYASYTTKANSHVAHGAYTCDACHFATTSNGTTITSVGRHVNRIYDLQWKTSVGSYGTFTYAYSTGGGTCSTIQCHNGTNAVWGSSGSASMDCIGCHSTAKAKAKYGTGTIGNYGSLTNRSGWTTMIRQVAGNGGDFAYPTFTRASRHLMGISTIGQITKWDCIVCHREGTSGGSSDATNHKDGMVHLRNVDTINNAVGYTVDNRLWNTIDYTNLDTFCLTCHDANGASAFTVNATNNGIDSTGARALTPFNTNDTAAGYISGSTWNTTARRALKVTNVKDQFFAGNGGSQGLVGGSAPSWTTGGVYNGNPSQHAVIGYRYNTIWTSWAATAWSTSTTLKKMNQTMRTAREVSLLSCADCHVLDAGGGAHGGRSAYNLWTSGSVAAWNTGYTQDMLCWKCHTRAVYTATGTPVAGSRVDHSANSDCGNVTSADSNGYGFGAMDKPCFVCHAGWNGSTTVTKQASYGGIHGSWSSTAWYTTGAAKTTAYRFFPGAWYRINRPSDAAWNSVSASPNCYFWPNAATGFASCNSHAGSSGSRGGTTDYNRPVKY